MSALILELRIHKYKMKQQWLMRSKRNKIIILNDVIARQVITFNKITVWPSLQRLL